MHLLQFTTILSFSSLVLAEAPSSTITTPTPGTPQPAAAVSVTCHFKLCTASASEILQFHAVPQVGVYGGIADSNPSGKRARESCHSTIIGRDQLWPICDPEEPCERGQMYGWTSSGCTRPCQDYNKVDDDVVGNNDWSLKSVETVGESSKGIKAWS